MSFHTRAAAAVALLLAAAMSVPASAQEKSQTYDEAELLQTGPLEDMVLGAEDAPVTIVEYASMTCPHCAHFHETVLPELKAQYLDTGKARLIFREYPLDRLALAASMVARCVEPERYFAFVGVLFGQQKTWVRENPVEPLKNLAKQAGLSDGAFDKCLANQELLDGIAWIQDRARDEFNVNGTPSFFINGESVDAGRVQTFEDMAKILDRKLDAGD